jgi:3',5'-cyclic AMP phosphodiesterase CpdA
LADDISRDLSRRAFARASVAAALTGCHVGAGPEQYGAPVVRQADRVRFAAIGDYGLAGPPAAAVAELVRSWDPEFIITLGDNNYPHGRASTLDENVGQYYGEFIAPYRGRHGAGGGDNRFFPSLGNHDWRTPMAAPYRDYFELPGREVYYEVRWGPVHLLSLDSDFAEVDGNEVGSPQAAWARRVLSASDARWKIVYFHHPPFSSGRHGSTRHMQWPFAQWGASVVLSGHDHLYERLDIDGTPYLVNGLGGHPERYAFSRPLPQSRYRFREDHGALHIEASADRLELRFMTVAGTEIDRLVLGA